MPETERAILTYEVLSSLDKGINELKEDMRYVKKCADEGKLNDNDAENAIKKAQASGDEGIKIGSLANQRIDKMIWWIAATLIGTMITVGSAIIVFLIQKGLRL